MGDPIADRSDEDLRSLAAAMRAYERLMDSVGIVTAGGIVPPDEAAIYASGDIIERNAARARERLLGRLPA